MTLSPDLVQVLLLAVGVAGGWLVRHFWPSATGSATPAPSSSLMSVLEQALASYLAPSSPTGPTTEAQIVSLLEKLLAAKAAPAVPAPTK